MNRADATHAGNERTEIRTPPLFRICPHAVKVRILRVPLEIAIDCLSGQLRREDYEIRD
jgi:hypothetical protein